MIEQRLVDGFEVDYFNSEVIDLFERKKVLDLHGEFHLEIDESLWWTICKTDLKDNIAITFVGDENALKHLIKNNYGARRIIQEERTFFAIIDTWSDG